MLVGRVDSFSVHAAGRGVPTVAYEAGPLGADMAVQAEAGLPIGPLNTSEESRRHRVNPETR